MKERCFVFEDVPWPPNYKYLLFHMRDSLPGGRGMRPTTATAKNEREKAWCRAKNAALLRYHPDKFAQNLGKRFRSDEDQFRAMENVNVIAQLINKTYEQIVTSSNI